MRKGSLQRFRLHAQHLGSRLAADSLVEATVGGLQDSAPRSGLLSLHARCADVGPDGWEHPGLVQVWGPRSAVYVVPADAHAAFTLGRLPRKPAAAEAILELGERAATALEGGPMPTSEVEAALGLKHPASLRSVAPSGRLLLRWDARTTTVSAVAAPKTTPDEARAELARRFLAWHGPADAAEYAAWAGVDERDAEVTLAAVGPQSDPADPGPVTGVRLLPPGDPYLYRDRRELVGSASHFDALFRPKGVLAGALLVDGRIVGVWNRQQRRLEVRPWKAVDRDRVAEEVDSLSGPLGGKVRLTFADD